MIKISILYLLLSVSAVAQTPPVCMPHEELDASLIDWYGERAVSQSDDGRWILWRNANTTSWTVVEYLENGLACTSAHGIGDRGMSDIPHMAALALPAVL